MKAYIIKSKINKKCNNAFIIQHYFEVLRKTSCIHLSQNVLNDNYDIQIDYRNALIKHYVLSP